MPYIKTEIRGFNFYLAFAIIAGALGSSFQHGYNTGVLNAPQSLIEKWLKEMAATEAGTFDSQKLENGTFVPTKEQSDNATLMFSIITAIFCVGGMIGGAMVGWVADTFGRKGGLLLNNILVIIAVVLEWLAVPMKKPELLVAGRLVIGINAGLNAGLSPMYLGEISPMHLRGAVGTVYQLIITISILVAQVLGLQQILGKEETWPLLVCLTIVPCIFQLLTLPLCPESPKYLLLNKGKDAEAQKSLSWLRGTTEVQSEMDAMRAEYESVKLVPKATVKDLLVNPALRIPLYIAVMIMLAQQFSGINAVMFFSSKIFATAGLNQEEAGYATMGVGAMNVLMTIVSLVLVEKAGRKTLLLLGFMGMFIDTSLLAVCMHYTHLVIAQYCAVILVIMFVVLFATGPGSIPWFLISEIFNQSARPAAASIAICVNWTANFIVSVGFLPLLKILGNNVFFIFAFLQLFFSIFIMRKVPETKNKTIEEVSAMFRARSYQ